MDEHAVLEECERGEDAAMRAYSAALEKDLPAEVGVIVRRQYAGVKENHGVVQKWPVLGNTDNRNPAARQGWF
jgi:uncharacterized protein (TIGR02284 family)